MDQFLQLLLTSLASVIASSGFWAYIQKKDQTKTAIARLLRGLAYDKIMTLGMAYIQRGWITKDEYEEFRKYLYEPYRDFGGNGVAERIMTEVSNLPLKSHNRYFAIVNEQESRENYNAVHTLQVDADPGRSDVRRP